MAELEKQEIASDDGVTENKGREAGLVPEFPTFGFDVKSEKADLVLIVENYRLYAKKSHLQFNSPVFESMIEENRGEMLTIDGVKCSDFAEFLACIQPRNRQKVSKKNVFRMVELAKKYDVEDLIERCEYCLIDMLKQETKPTGIKAIALFLDNAFKYELETLKSECLNISAELDEGSMNDKIALKKLDSTARCQLYETWLPRLTTKARLADIFLTSLKKEERQLISGISESKGLVMMSYESFPDQDSHSYNFKKWGIMWKLCVKFPSTLKGNKRLISIQLEDKKDSKAFTSLIMVSVVIPNHIVWNEDKTFLKLVRFDSSYSIFSQENKIYLDSDVEDESLGFKLKGKLTLNVQMLFGKPVYLD